MLIVNHYAAPLARRDSWLRRVEIYDNYAESPYTRMAEVLIQRGLDRETVGFEKNYLSAVRWEEIRPSRAAGQYAEIFGPSDPCVGYAAETFSYQQPPGR